MAFKSLKFSSEAPHVQQPSVLLWLHSHRSETMRNDQQRHQNKNQNGTKKNSKTRNKTGPKSPFGTISL